MSNLQDSNSNGQAGKSTSSLNRRVQKIQLRLRLSYGAKNSNDLNEISRV